MKNILILFITSIIACNAETIQSRYASVATMPELLLMGLDLPLQTNLTDVVTWSTPTNVCLDGSHWTIRQTDKREFDNCSIIELSLSTGVTNMTARLSVCDTAETAAFSLVLPMVGFSSMSPLEMVDQFVVSTNAEDVVFIDRVAGIDEFGTAQFDLSRSDAILSNVSLTVQGSTIAKQMLLSLLSLGTDTNLTSNPQSGNLQSFK